MDKNQKPIFIDRNPSSANFILMIFTAISTALSDMHFNGSNAIMKRDKTFNFDKEYFPLRDKIIAFYKSPETLKTKYLELTPEESQLFRDCAHAAYYFRTENPEPKIAKSENEWIEWYQANFIYPANRT